jgi:RNA polymerase sigma factor (sigma-70 family)
MKPEISHPPATPPARPTFAEVYAQGADYVFRTLRRMGVAEADCPDATQEVFVVVHRRLPGYEPRERLFGWLAAITANIAAQHRDKNRRTPLVDPAADPGDVTSTPATSASPATSTTPPLDPEDAIATRALALLLLQDVEPERRLVLVLHHVDQMSTREIAEALAIPKGTADTRLRLAQQEFKAAFRRYEARCRREDGRGSILPIFGPLTLLEAEREIPPIPDELRARIWARLEHLDKGGGGGDGGGNDGGMGQEPRAAASEPAVQLSRTVAAAAFGGVLALGFVLGVLWSSLTAQRASTAATPRAAATIAQPGGAGVPEAAPSPSEVTPPSAPPATSSPSAAALFPGIHAERAMLVKAETALATGETAAALAAAEEHSRMCHGGGILAPFREDVWIRALLRAGRIGEARARIDRLDRLYPGNPNIDTYRAAAGAPR